jgi:hypothetical protein
MYFWVHEFVGKTEVGSKEKTIVVELYTERKSRWSPALKVPGCLQIAQKLVIALCPATISITNDLILQITRFSFNSLILPLNGCKSTLLRIN